jgi:hypothetical protein
VPIWAGLYWLARMQSTLSRGPYGLGFAGLVTVRSDDQRWGRLVRQVSSVAVALIVLFSACGGSSLWLDECVEQLQTRADDLQAAGEEFVVELSTAVDPRTGAVFDVVRRRSD